MKSKEQLAELRTRQGLTQGELASRINVSWQTVYKWERGTAAPSTENLIALSRLYGVPLEELVNGELPPQEASVAVAAEEPEAPPPTDGETPKKQGRNIAVAAVLAACLLLVTIASVITIWSAIFKEPEKPKDGLTIINQDDLQWENIDLEELMPFDGAVKIIDNGVIQFEGTVPGISANGNVD